MIDKWPGGPERLSGRTQRPPAGCRRRMRDVVCQLVGIGMVSWYVMNGRGVDCATVQHEVWHGERFHVSTQFTMFGACLRLTYMSRTTATWIFRLCIGKISFGPSMRLWGGPVLFLRRGKDGALHRLEGSLAEMEVHTSPGIGNIFAAIAVCYVYECIMGNSLSIWHQMPLWRSGQHKKLL